MTDNDVTLLKLVNESGDVADIGYYRQQDTAADSRLNSLINQGFIKKHEKNSDSSNVGDYEITGRGYAFLTDYDLGIQKSESAKKRALLSNIYIPLVVTLLINIVLEAAKIVLR